MKTTNFFERITRYLKAKERITDIAFVKSEKQREQFALGHNKGKNSEKLSKHGENYEFLRANRSRSLFCKEQREQVQGNGSFCLLFYWFIKLHTVNTV